MYTTLFRAFSPTAYNSSWYSPVKFLAKGWYLVSHFTDQQTLIIAGLVLYVESQLSQGPGLTDSLVLFIPTLNFSANIATLKLKQKQLSWHSPVYGLDSLLVFSLTLNPLANNIFAFLFNLKSDINQPEQSISIVD